MGLVVPPDARVFLGRLTHLHPAAVVRLRPSAPGRVALWGRVPWEVLVTREVDAEMAEDVTVSAAALLDSAGELPERRDRLWRWPLPPDAGAVVEQLPAGQVRELAAAAAGTLREVTRTGLSGRAVGARRLRDALLDHVAIVVDPAAAGAGRVEIPQRLVQAAVRMGFLGEEAGEPAGGPVRVRVAGAWVGLAAYFGTAWLPPPGPPVLRPVRPG